MAEAEKVFRENQEAFIKWQQRGGSNSTPSEFSSISAGKSLVNVGQLLKMQKKDGWRLASGPSPRVFIAGPISGLQMSGSEIAIGGCVDSSATKIIFSTGLESPGVAVQYRSFFRRFGGQLKEIDEQSRKVPQC